MVLAIKKRSEFTYRCQICGYENLHTKMDQSVLPVTLFGRQGDTQETTATPLELEAGGFLDLEGGGQLLLESSITVKQGYETYADTMYTATSISFIAAAGSVPAKLSDANLKFADKHIMSNMSITITTGSGTNDGSYTIADRGVTRGEISVTPDLTTEDAATAGEVTIKRIIYQPNVINGCPFCGSLNSRR